MSNHTSSSFTLVKVSFTIIKVLEIIHLKRKRLKGKRPELSYGSCRPRSADRDLEPLLRVMHCGGVSD